MKLHVGAFERGDLDASLEERMKLFRYDLADMWRFKLKWPPNVEHFTDCIFGFWKWISSKNRQKIATRKWMKNAFLKCFHKACKIICTAHRIDTGVPPLESPDVGEYFLSCKEGLETHRKFFLTVWSWVSWRKVVMVGNACRWYFSKI